MLAKKRTKTKIKLADLFGEEGEANADLFKEEPDRREHHLRHRTPRNRLITPRGAEYTRQLAGDAKRDLQLNELAREWVNNGMNKTRAVSAVFGVSLKSAKANSYMKIFESSHFRAKAALMINGVDGEFAEPAKEYAIQRLMRILDMNILDYIDNDGRWLTVSELKALPRDLQVMIDAFTMVNTVRHVALRDVNGEVAKDEHGNPHMVEVREQQVTLKLPDKTTNLRLLSDLMKWIETHGGIYLLSSDVMVRAEARIMELHRHGNDIEGEARQVTAD